MRRWLRQRGAEAGAALLGRLARGVPGVVGPLLVAVGLGLAWLPLGIVSAGVILWAVDLRIPSPQPQQISGDPRRPGNARKLRAAG